MTGSDGGRTAWARARCPGQTVEAGVDNAVGGVDAILHGELPARPLDVVDNLLAALAWIQRKKEHGTGGISIPPHTELPSACSQPVPLMESK